MRQRPRRILPVIIASQFAGTSLWFSGNAVLDDLQRQWSLPPEAIGYITSSVQLGFIAGTLTFAFFALADRVSPRLLFLVCSLLGALANAAPLLGRDSLAVLLASRFATGFFLAGIYPVGMKIAAGWYQRNLGNALGLLVGALVLGTAFPHLLKGLDQALPWHAVMLAVSALAALGGLLVYALIPDGPYLGPGGRFDPRTLATTFRVPAFRASAFGYFGHMWELYGFWVFVPWVLAAHVREVEPVELNVPLWTFAVIAAGSLGCAAGGLLSLRRGSAPRGRVGSALTIANCIGFAITVFSIQLLSTAADFVSAQWLLVLLAPGPLLGLAALLPLLRGTSEKTPA